MSTGDDGKQDVPDIHMEPVVGDDHQPPLTWKAKDVFWDGFKCQVLGTPAGQIVRRRQRDGCQVQGCTNKLQDLKRYYQRHRICEQHMAMDVMEFDGVQQRFCQQCGRFQALSQVLPPAEVLPPASPLA